MNLEVVIRSIVKSHEYIQGDPEASLNYARKSAEAICKVVFATHVGIPDGIMLNELLKQLSNKKLIPAKMVQPLFTIQKYGNFGSHPQPDSDVIDAEYIAPCIIALKQVTRWFFEEFLKTQLPAPINEAWSRVSKEPSQMPVGTFIAYPHELRAWYQWDIEEIIHQVIALDYDTVHNLNDYNEGRHDQWLPVVTNHPETICLLVNGSDKKIVGYWHFVSLFEKYFTLAKQGKLYDLEITPDKVSFLGLPGIYHMYFVIISMLPRYRSVSNFRLLLDALCNRLTAFAEQDIFFEEICANAFTDDGISLCETLRMQYICGHEEFGKIYALKLLPIPHDLRFLQCHPKLIELYSNCKFITRESCSLYIPGVPRDAN